MIRRRRAPGAVTCPSAAVSGGFCVWSCESAPAMVSCRHAAHTLLPATLPRWRCPRYAHVYGRPCAAVGACAVPPGRRLSPPGSAGLEVKLSHCGTALCELSYGAGCACLVLRPHTWSPVRLHCCVSSLVRLPRPSLPAQPASLRLHRDRLSSGFPRRLPAAVTDRAVLCFAVAEHRGLRLDLVSSIAAASVCGAAILHPLW